MTHTDRALEANARHAAALESRTGAAVSRPQFAVVTCMDGRIDPARAFGLEEGRAHVIRNAGGRIADAIRSLVISQMLLGTEEVMIVHHTDCAMRTFTDEDLRRQIQERGADAAGMAFLPFTDLDESVRADLDAYARSTLVRQDIPVRGFVFDVSTGRLREVRREPTTRTAGESECAGNPKPGDLV